MPVPASWPSRELDSESIPRIPDRCMCRPSQGGLEAKTHRRTHTPVCGTRLGEASGEWNRRGDELEARQRRRRLIHSPEVGAGCPTDGRHGIPCRNAAQPMVQSLSRARSREACVEIPCKPPGGVTQATCVPAISVQRQSTDTSTCTASRSSRFPGCTPRTTPNATDA